MKRLLFFLALSLTLSSTIMAQEVRSNEPFTTQWKLIDSLVTQGLPQSALEALGKLQATLNKGEPQLPHKIKATLYELTLKAQLEEQGDWNAIQALEQKMLAAKETEKAVYSSYLAEQYNEYWQRNRWRISNRTERESQTPTADETTWSAKNLVQHITKLYLQSILDTRTRSISLQHMAPLIYDGLQTEGLRPTLYDILLHRALTHFRYNEAFVGESRYEPALDDIALLSSSAEFAALQFPEVQQKTSFQHLLESLQEALVWSAETREATTAQLDLDLIRLQVVYDQLSTEEKHQAYETALLNLQAIHRGKDSEAMVLMNLMSFSYQRAQYYVRGNSAHENLRWKLVEVVSMAEDILNRFPKTLAAEEAGRLIQEIRHPNLGIAIEAVQLPETMGLIQLSYKNVKNLHFRVLSISQKEYFDAEKSTSDLEAILRRRTVHKWKEELPQANDFREHITEAALPALKRGIYCLAVSSQQDFSFEEGATGLLYFWVSDLAFLDQRDNENGVHRVLVVKRSTGEAVPDATLKIWSTQNSRQRSNEPRLIGTYQTDERGLAIIKDGKQENVRIELITEEDQLFADESLWIYTNGRRRDNEPPPYTEFFTDRGLYRPGQIVYFKALALQQRSKIPEVVSPGTKFTITLKDVNGQDIDQLEVQTNRFGSATGQFTLPVGGRFGNFSLHSSLGNGTWHSIRVEEYKRPRFEVKLEELADEVRIGDSVMVTGSALGYAGPSVADAEVNYTVTRRVSFPWRWGYRSYFPSYANPVTLASGNTRTDDKGTFSIAFLAASDGTVDEKQYPLYSYDVNVTVIDGTGETRTAEKQLRLTQNPFELHLNLEAEQDRSAGLAFEMGCTNLDGQELTKAVKVRARLLLAPYETYIPRYWERPDTFLMSERFFRKNFPLFSYSEDEEPANWEEGPIVWEGDLTLEGKDKLTLQTKKWPVGHYQLELYTITANGDSLGVTERFAMHDWQNNEFATGNWLYSKSDKKLLEPGEELLLQLGEQKDPVHIFAALSDLQGRKWEKWMDGTDAVSQEVVDSDRGDLRWGGYYLLHNRVHYIDAYWTVPWSNKELDISFESFRSKLYPDTEEEWIIRIDGPERERVAAEVLASMYDASLDQILPFDWDFNAFPQGVRQDYWQAVSFRALQQGVGFQGIEWKQFNSTLTYPTLWNPRANYGRRFRNAMGGAPELYSAEMAPSAISLADQDSDTSGATLNSEQIRNLPTKDVNAIAAKTAGLSSELGAAPVKVRTNLSETAFFFPQLATNKEGRVLLKFRAPEALTRWKLQLFAHDQQLAYALDHREVVTQKELMILPNAPRFLRENDQISFTAKVSNLSKQPLSGQASLELFDLITGASLADDYQLSAATVPFELDTLASQTVRWNLVVPKKGAGTLGYRVIARSAEFSDGEESALPVLTNSILLTEAQPLFVRGRSTKNFELARLKSASENTNHHAFRLDITSNPAWEAIKALPYLQEYPYDCTEQLVNRIFANSLATKVVVDYPKTREIFESWRRNEEGLKSPLLQNQELKTALLEETPWVLDAKNESLQRERIALLFDLDRMAGELSIAQQKLLDRQTASGGFSWFPGGREHWYMTQYVAEQLSHLHQLTGQSMNNDLRSALERALQYCDGEAQDWYIRLKAQAKEAPDQTPGPRIAHYLYARSLNLQVEMKPHHTDMYAYCWAMAEKHWLNMNLHSQALIALAAKHSNRTKLAQTIFASLGERALHSAEQGTYWKYNDGFYWYQNSIETHVKLIELYQLMKAGPDEMAELKIWLLRNKETNRWETTKATAAAIFALVSNGEDWLGETTPLEVSFPSLPKSAYEPKLKAAEARAEAGTGAYQVKWTAMEVVPEMGRIRLRNNSKAPGWGAIYWQYFQDIDQVTADGNNPLRIERQLYRKVNEGEGDILQALEQQPKAGDRITVRLVIRTDRDMEFVHLKDLRASGLEPIEQLSHYRYQAGLGYYQQTTDLGTHFFFDYLPKGEHVMEYDLRVFHQGDFSGGLSTLQCMYAPKFTSHSEGIRLRVGE